MLGRANSLAQREAAIAALKCLCIALVPICLSSTSRMHSWYLGWEKSKSQQMGFYLLMTCSGCPLSVSTGDFIIDFLSCVLTSCFAPSGFVMSCPFGSSSIMLGDPVEADSYSCPLLHWQRMEQPYIIVQTARRWQTKATTSIKPLFKLHFCALMPRLASASTSLASFLTQIPSRLLFSPHISGHLPLHLFLFQCDNIYQCLTTASVNIISMCPSVQPQVNILIHSGTVSLDRRLEKGRSTSERKDRGLKISKGHLAC